MVKLIFVLSLLTYIGRAVHTGFYDCKQRAYCNRYRSNLIWGGNDADAIKFKTQYKVDNFTIVDETSQIQIGLSLNLTALDDATSFVAPSTPVGFYEETLIANLTFYANGAMRIEVDDARKERFQIANTDMADLVLDSKLEKLEDLREKVE